jgi:hypothetical protein
VHDEVELIQHEHSECGPQRVDRKTTTRMVAGLHVPRRDTSTGYGGWQQGERSER